MIRELDVSPTTSKGQGYHGGKTGNQLEQRWYRESVVIDDEGTKVTDAYFPYNLGCAKGGHNCFQCKLKECKWNGKWGTLRQK